MRSRDDPSVRNNRPRQIDIVQDEGKSKTCDLQFFLYICSNMLNSCTKPPPQFCYIVYKHAKNNDLYYRTSNTLDMSLIFDIWLG